MKLSNIFKKKSKTESIKMEKVEKGQLGKVIGGAENTTTLPTTPRQTQQQDFGQ